MDDRSDIILPFKSQSFWQKPEGVAGIISLIGIFAGLGFLAFSFLPFLTTNITKPIPLTILIAIVLLVSYSIINPSVRKSVWFLYKNTMRWITGKFVNIDPISVLHKYLAELRSNLDNLKKQSAKLRGQMHKMKELIFNNEILIKQNLEEAKSARLNDHQTELIVKSRKAGRLQESNLRLEALYQKMMVLYQILSRMYDNSKILYEDINDQILIKEQEQKAVHATHNAMQSARSIIKGNPDKRALFDTAMEAVAEDVGNKMGELERFMHASNNFMNAIDLQNGVFEESGLKLLEEWEKEAGTLILGKEKENLLKPEVLASSNQYDKLFD
ncbi:MAG: hypothetical protein RLZZ417_927 [Bacteroidota bacterium]|jgi:hypothetical protein